MTAKDIIQKINNEISPGQEKITTSRTLIPKFQVTKETKDNDILKYLTPIDKFKRKQDNRSPPTEIQPNSRKRTDKNHDTDLNKQTLISIKEQSGNPASQVQ